MKHYTREEWLEYKKGLNCNKNIMEEHLKSCNKCRKLFLELIDDSELTRAGMIVPDNFSSITMQYITSREVSPKSLTHSRKRLNLLTYYAIAATITLMLFSQGFFQLVIKEASKVPTVCTEQKVDISTGSIFNWPVQLSKKSLDLTHVIPKTINLEEVIK